ncbi:ubiquitin-protein ligase [Lithospermum erythrorhizon]|uniref:Ubiquitin-protein ligase n=1 Tax=Lithospermum erythrorhizon TaxID=34254 RepID=A0AAV3Q4B7_LITER
MDESAVSSDPVSAFLLDEVVVKDWCKQTFRSILSDSQVIYNGSVQEMFRSLDSLLKFSAKLASIANILEVLESSFKDSHAAKLHDVHGLQENISKMKQHMDIMAWSIRHNFLEDVTSRHESISMWRDVVRERNEAALTRAWPDYVNSSAESFSQQPATLFIEDALSNLEAEQELADSHWEEYHIESLQKEPSFSYYNSEINGMAGCYPFENLRAAADILFLRGSPDLVVAKQAIFLYYLFDRHWTMPEEDWRHIIDDFAATFSISRHSLLESFTFYLLDDHTSEALQEACRLLPEISGPTIHPKVSQVLLERENAYGSLMVMRWSGRDGAELASLGEAITAVRVRIECGLLTEAFMYQRMVCMKLKERRLNDKSSQKGNDYGKDERCSWSLWVEALVIEICRLCIRRNLVEHMIDFPWNKDEEKHIYKCLLEFCMEDPSTVCGSLLVVYFLQRYRYIDAYQVDQKLQNVEKDFIVKGSATEEVLSKMRSTSQWRAGLIGKSVELLPDVLQQKLKSGKLSDDVKFPSNEAGNHEEAEVSMEENILTGFAPPRLHGSSLVLGVDSTVSSFQRCSPPETQLKMNGFLNNIKMTSGVSSPLTTTLLSDANKGLRSKSSFSKRFNFDTATPPIHTVGYPSPSPLRNFNNSSTRAQLNRSLPSYQVNEASSETAQRGFASKFHATSHGKNQGRSTGLAHGNHPSTPVEPTHSEIADRSPPSNDMMEVSWSNDKRLQLDDVSVNGGARWRSDDFSDDEEYQTPDSYTGITSHGKHTRGTRRSRRLRG